MKGWTQQRLFTYWRRRHIKNWHILLLFILFSALTVYFLRQNNLTMDRLRNDVVLADEQGGDVATAIKKLNEHVFSHMNTRIVRPIELVHTYNKQAKLAIEAASSETDSDLYARATAQCERRGIPLSSVAQCAADYALSEASTSEAPEIALPDKSLFTYTFASPRWTPDAAGLMLLLSGVILIWLLVRGAEYMLVRLIVRRRHKNQF